MTPLNCCKCGRFIGPDGRIDIIYDDYHGGHEAGYSYCGKCLREQEGATNLPEITDRSEVSDG